MNKTRNLDCKIFRKKIKDTFILKHIEFCLMFNDCIKQLKEGKSILFNSKVKKKGKK